MIAAVTRLRAAARVCWFSKPRSRKRPSRWKATARTRLLRASPLFNSAVTVRRSAGSSNQRNVNSVRSEEHTSELQSLMRTSYAVFGLEKKTILQQQLDEDSYTMRTKSKR